MNKDNFIKLTNSVYKVLEFFPESDPLKNRAKDKALAIMEHLVSMDETSGWASFQKEKTKVQLFEDIDVLLGYLWIGKSQKWMNSVSYLVIANEYEKLRKGVEPVIELMPKLSVVESQPIVKEVVKIEPKEDGDSVLSDTELKAPYFSVSDRQKQILDFLSKNERAQVMDLQTILPDITKRTIRRDLEELLEAGRIIRSGDFNQVFYKISEDSKLVS